MDAIDKDVKKTLPQTIEFDKRERAFAPGVISLWNAKAQAEMEFNAAYSALADMVIERTGIPMTVEQFIRHYTSMEKTCVRRPDGASPQVA